MCQKGKGDMSSNQISFNQVGLLMKKFEKMGWTAERITSLGQAGRQKFRAIEEILDGTSLEEAIKTAIVVKEVALSTTHLRHLETVLLGPAKGTTTIAGARAVFPIHLDPDFKRWGTDVAGNDTTQMPVDIYEVTKNGSVVTLFGSLVPDTTISNWWRPLCHSQGQIVEFAIQHKSKLHQGDHSTFFLFEVKGATRPFIAEVGVYDASRMVGVSRFVSRSLRDVDTRCRLVIPQQTL
jgi:hypothetical protein